MEAEGSEVQGHPQPHSKLETCLESLAPLSMPQRVGLEVVLFGDAHFSQSPLASRSNTEGSEPSSTVSALGVNGPGTHGVHPADDTVLGGASRTSTLHGPHL